MYGKVIAPDISVVFWRSQLNTNTKTSKQRTVQTDEQTLSFQTKNFQSVIPSKVKINKYNLRSD